MSSEYEIKDKYIYWQKDNGKKKRYSIGLPPRPEVYDTMVAELADQNSDMYKSLTTAFVNITKTKLDKYKKQLSDASSNVLDAQEDYLNQICSYGLSPQVYYIKGAKPHLLIYGDATENKIVDDDKNIKEFEIKSGLASKESNKNSKKKVSFPTPSDELVADAKTSSGSDNFKNKDKILRLVKDILKVSSKEEFKAIFDRVKDSLSQYELNNLKSESKLPKKPLDFNNDKIYHDDTIMKYMRSCGINFAARALGGPEQVTVSKFFFDIGYIYTEAMYEKAQATIRDIRIGKLVVINPSISDEAAIQKIFRVQYNRDIFSLSKIAGKFVNSTDGLKYNIKNLERIGLIMREFETMKLPNIKTEQIRDESVLQYKMKCRQTPQTHTKYDIDGDRQKADPPDNVSHNHRFFNAVDERNKIKKEYLHALTIYYNLTHADEATIQSCQHHKIKALIWSLAEFRVKISGKSRLNIRNNVAKLVIAFSNDPISYTTKYLNFALLGPAGSGKTTIAKYIGAVFRNLGLLFHGDFQLHSKATLVAGYVGQTAPLTKAALVRALENVMMIDEAYAIMQGGKEGFGDESITEIVGFLDKHQGELVLMVAGYVEEMEKLWFEPNPGMQRRFPYKWHLFNYDGDDLLNILNLQFRWIPKSKQSPNKLVDVLSAPSIALLQLIFHKYGLVKENDKEYTLFINQGGDMENIAKAIQEEYSSQLGTKYKLPTKTLINTLDFVIERGENKSSPTYIPNFRDKLNSVADFMTNYPDKISKVLNGNITTEIDNAHFSINVLTPDM